MKPVERSWSWEFAVPPEALWPLVADTNRLNEAGGAPRYRLAERARPDGTVERGATLERGPFRLVWDERPPQWVTNRVFRQQRHFHNRPVRYFCPTFAFERIATGTRVTVTFCAAPRNLLGAILLQLGLIERAGKVVGKLIREAGAFAEGRRETVFGYAPAQLPAGARERAAPLLQSLAEAGYGLAPRLGELVLAAPENEIDRVRPKALARSWGIAVRDAVELCLAAAKAGLLDLRWDLLCPRCRGAKASVATLDQLPRGAHCPSCNIAYDRDFARNVEATFRPAAALRPLAGGGYCLASPMATGHVLVQQTLAPGERREIEGELPPGRYRLRTVEPGGEVDFDHPGGGFPEAIVEGARVSTGGLAPPGRIVLRNEGPSERTVAIETRDWAADALTAHELTTLQAFRDFFAAEALRPGDEVEIRRVTLMFTDLEGSTALYSRLGDARAYAVVREHYAFLGRTIREHDGAIVKTIGDAVMAAFAEPTAALAAALAVQRGVA